MPGNHLLRLDNEGNVIPAGNISLRDASLAPEILVNEGGIEPILKGLITQMSQKIDLG